MSDLRLPNLNAVMLAGRLTRDPELRHLPNGTAVCKLGVAATRYYKSGDEKKEETLFIDVTAWAKTAEWVGENLHKASEVLIEGRLQQEEWPDKETGEIRRKIGIVAERIQPLTWHTKSNEEKGESKPARRDDVPVPEDGIPF